MPTSFCFPDALQAARGGNQAALDSLFDAYYPMVERLAHRALLEETPHRRAGIASLFSTGDVVQESCRVVMRDLSQFEGETEAKFVCYLATVVRNRLQDLLRFHGAARRDRRRVDGTTSGLVGTTPSPLQDVGAREEAQVFLAVLSEMPLRERRLLLGRLERDESFVELAAELGFPSADAARKAFHRAHARLLISMRKSGIRPTAPLATQNHDRVEATT